jgi:hypothetical protein
MSSDAEPQTPSAESSPATERIKHEIEHTRSELSDTVAALEEKLAPSQVREAVSAELQLVEDRVRNVLGDQLTQAKAVVEAEVLEAKNALRAGLTDAERLIRTGLSEARESVRNDLKDAVTGARDSVRAATLGRIETFATNLGDSMNDARDTLLDTVYKNPLPATLAGVGLAWLLMNRSKSASARRSDSGNGNGHSSDNRLHEMGENLGAAVGSVGAAVGKAAHQATGAVADGVQGATDAAGNVLESASGMVTAVAQAAGQGAQHAAHTARDGATALASSAQQSAKRVEQVFQRQLRERPLAVGAAALAIGTMVGCALPHTDAEDELMGDTRDNLLYRAGDVVHDAAESVANLSEKARTEDESKAASAGAPKS